MEKRPGTNSGDACREARRLPDHPARRWFSAPPCGASEREAALAAESVVRLHCDRPGGIGFVIDAADARASRRIAAYISDVMAEVWQSDLVAQA